MCLFFIAYCLVKKKMTLRGFCRVYIYNVKICLVNDGKND